MVDPEVFERRLGRLEELLRDLRVLTTVEQARFLADKGLQAQAERWTHLAIECCLDLANHLIADKGWPSPATYRESFERLQVHGVIDAGLATHMARWAGLRNILVHLYLDVDHQRLYEILTKELDQLEAFGKAMADASGEM